MTTERLQFAYDVFLSHSSKDKARIGPLAERLRDQGLRVWFDEWEIRPGDDVFLKIEDGLQNSRTLVLAMSKAAFDSEWVGLERSTVLFRDPANSERRFIPLLIEDCAIPDVIRRYRYIDWQRKTKAAFAELVEACQASHAQAAAPPPAAVPRSKAATEMPLLGAELVWRQGCHTNYVASVAVLPDGKRAISASYDNTLRLWRISSGECLATFEGHKDAATSVAVLPDGERAISGSCDNTLRLWHIRSGECLATFEGHQNTVWSVAVLPDGERAISGSADSTLKLWHIPSGKCLATFEGHTGSVWSVAALPDGERAISASSDDTLKLWQISSGIRLATLEGHTDFVTSVAVLSDGERAISGSTDNTLELWQISSGRCLATLEGHTDWVWSVAALPDGERVVSASLDGTLRLWHLDTGESVILAKDENAFYSVAVLPDGSGVIAGMDNDVAFYRLTSGTGTGATRPPAVEQRALYTNAKVVLLGESGVGKSGLGHRLAENKWVVTDSTHGMRVWPFQAPHLPNDPGTERDVWLWDLAGQPEYRLTHQLFLDETSLALVAFDPSHPDDPFRGVDGWLSALKVAVKGDPTKLLVAARTDRGGATVTREKIERFLKEKGFAAYVSTSAKTGDGCDELLAAIAKHIPWEEIAPIVTTRLFKAMKDAIIRLREHDNALIRCAELRQQVQMALPGEAFAESELRTVVGLLAGQGLVKHLAFGDFVLLKPEMLNNYASAVVREAREHTDGIGSISESAVLEGSFDFRGMPRLGKEDEEILLRAMVQTFVEQALCIRESGMLVFPSQFNREMPDIPEHPFVLVTYQFTGPLANIYTTLVAKLHYSQPFEKKELWKNAAEFRTPEGKTVGFAMEVVGEGVGRIKVFFEEGVPDDTRVVFIKYIHEHLRRNAENVEREREYVCPSCGYAVKDRDAIKRRLSRGKTDIVCADCDEPVALLDLIEETFGEDRTLRKVRELEEQADIAIDTQSRELILVGHMFKIAGEAGQYFEKYDGSRYGLDGEIEFKTDGGKPTGRRIYVQLKSGDSHLRDRVRDSREVFDVHNPDHIKYWQAQAYDVYLVILDSRGTIRWMNVADYLKNRKDKESKQIIFEGEQLTAFSLRRLRDRCVHGIRDSEPLSH